jgi:Flp pilus assembly protein TadG
MINRGKMFRGCLGRRGAAAFEFVVVAPFLILLTIGVVEFAAAIRIQMGVNQAARTVANLISAQSDVTTAQLNDFFIAGRDCYSFNVGTLAISATAVNFTTGSQNGTQAWSANSVSGSYAAPPSNWQSLANGLAATSSTGTIPGGDATIVVQASTTFTVPVSFGPIKPSYTLTSTVFARPRISYQITLN